MNRLRDESSQYLKAHAKNPVDWYPWSAEALAKSKKENKPIFLSIGYSACHWCHVMEKESFENEEVAKVMNQYFVNIKVDREERQDLDHIYMTAIQLLTGRGGWPMSVFLTPELKPFYGGTYFPPEDRHGLPGFKKVLLGIANAWSTKKQEVLSSSEQLFESLSQIHPTPSVHSETLPSDLLKSCAEKIIPNFDEKFGGIGSAPKFFHTGDLHVILRAFEKSNSKVTESIKKTLAAWAMGGIFDHLGGGFHRYSTDQYWFAPHFEKMLYDNALVVGVYLEAYRLFKEPLYSQTASQTLDYILREMCSEEGAFFSTQDADSEGIEGKFYVWSKKELSDILGKDLTETFCKVYNVTEEGNWEHGNILYRLKSFEEHARELEISPAELEDSLSLCRRKLLTKRNSRLAPETDKKIILSWNGMMIDTLARASLTLSNESYLEAAIKAAEFALIRLKNTEGLLHSFQDGKATLNAYLDDWANFIQGLITLYETTREQRWLLEATQLTQGMIDNFYDPKLKDFYFTGQNHPTLIFRPRESYDGATPSATAVATTCLTRLGRITTNSNFISLAEGILKNYLSQIQKIPSAYSQMLLANTYLQPECKEIVWIAGKDNEENKSAFHQLNETYLGTHVWIHPVESLKSSPLLKGKNLEPERVTMYLCQNQTCSAPMVGLNEISEY